MAVSGAQTVRIIPLETSEAVEAGFYSNTWHMCQITIPRVWPWDSKTRACISSPNRFECPSPSSYGSPGSSAQTRRRTAPPAAWEPLVQQIEPTPSWRWIRCPAARRWQKPEGWLLLTHPFPPPLSPPLKTSLLHPICSRPSLLFPRPEEAPAHVPLTTPTTGWFFLLTRTNQGPRSQPCAALLCAAIRFLLAALGIEPRASLMADKQST